jgi:two-component system phosphate regulon sensor histidine kinase PhoR
MFLLRSMSPLLGATVLFMAGIVFAFSYSLRTIFKQKNISDALIEFINNMTHEFKTPISTIALASEAIARPDILQNGDKVLRYNEIIHDENARMKQQAEKILQMAVLEEGDYELHLVPLDAHEVIRKAVESIALQVERKGGQISCRLDAKASIVNADAVHMANIIHNLLDNANKYSPGEPRIEISTANTDGLLRIQVQDNGIGMNEDDARRAFDKYFRVATGNQHDVKGFGLGLSYVKLMVEAHKGSIRLKSAPGAGTTVELYFPVAVNGEVIPV